MRAHWAPLLLVACGGEANAPPPTAPLTRVVVGVPVAAPPRASAELALTGAAEQIGTSGAGTPLVVIDGALFEVLQDTLEQRTLYATGDDPRALGAVHAIAARADDGAWLATDAGLFRLEGSYLSAVPIPLDHGARAVADVGSGPLAGLWIATGDGLLRRNTEGYLTELTVAGDAIAALDVAVDAGAGHALVAVAGASPQRLSIDAAEDLLIEVAPIPEARAVVAARGALWAATDGGLFRWRAIDEPRWTQFTLAAEGASPVPVRALAVDAVGDAVWVRTDALLVHVTVDGVLTALATSPRGQAPPLIAVDGRGDAWTAADATLSRVSLFEPENPVRFAADVGPWIATHCAACHDNATANFTDYAVFVGRAEDALRRVQSGDMPRCDGGLPCPDRLSPALYGVLERWIRQGKPE